jgi:hypothetical protein
MADDPDEENSRIEDPKDNEQTIDEDQVPSTPLISDRKLQYVHLKQFLVANEEDIPPFSHLTLFETVIKSPDGNWYSIRCPFCEGNCSNSWAKKLVGHVAANLTGYSGMNHHIKRIHYTDNKKDVHAIPEPAWLRPRFVQSPRMTPGPPPLETVAEWTMRICPKELVNPFALPAIKFINVKSGAETEKGRLIRHDTRKGSAHQVHIESPDDTLKRLLSNSRSFVPPSAANALPTGSNEIPLFVQPEIRGRKQSS